MFMLGVSIITFHVQFITRVAQSFVHNLKNTFIDELLYMILKNNTVAVLFVVTYLHCKIGNIGI